MALSLDQLCNGLTPEHDLFFAEKPAEDEMRESTSIWLYEENGEFAFPRLGIEAEAWSWDERLYTGNFALGGGRTLNAMGRGPGPSAIGADGRPSILGAGPLRFECLDPFRRWRVVYEGSVADGTVAQQISSSVNWEKQIPVRLDVELEMVTPAWVFDNSPEKVAQMSEAEKGEAASMGIGWRLEHLFRGEGRFEVDGQSRDFRGTGLRIKRQSVRPLTHFRGHCWQSAVFPDGRAFGFIAYPPGKDGAEPYNDAYVYQDGKMHAARATRIPWLRELREEGGDVSLELESALGVTRIEATATLASYHVMDLSTYGPEKDTGTFSLHQGGARYRWDGMSAYGMIERSSTEEQLAG